MEKGQKEKKVWYRKKEDKGKHGNMVWIMMGSRRSFSDINSTESIGVPAWERGGKTM